MPIKNRALIFPAGSEIGLEIYRSLRYNLHVDVYGASGKSDHARFIYPPERYEEGPYFINSHGFLSAFNDLLSRWKINFIYPTHDTIALWLADNAHLLKAKVIGSSVETARVARSKKLTYKTFEHEEFCPAMYGAMHMPDRFPVFVKPDDGQGGQGACVVSSWPDLQELVSSRPNLVVTEYLPGEELSVDCFTDRHGVVRFVGPRTRSRVTIGISYESQAVPITPEIRAIAESINSRVKLRGAWFFQIKKSYNSKWKLLEFAARQSSTMGLYRPLGVNFALLSLFDAMEMDVEILNNGIGISLSRRLQNVYKLDYAVKRVYLDFDDTLIIDDKVNVQAMAFVYQCRNKSVPVVLLTKHRYDIYESLRRHAIDAHLFDEIITLREDEEKHCCIDEEGAIFVDNYFADRAKVAREKRIPVFDVDGIDGLMHGQEL
jgi:hypothetical protein